MRNVYVVCEGQTEANFVNRALIPVFYDRMNLIPRTVVTSRDARKGSVHKGGMSSYAKAYNTIEVSLKDALRHGGFVTTMFDFYALPKDTPGIDAVPCIADAYQKAAGIESSMLQAVSAEYRGIYHPYIQLHEFEALVFCNLGGLEEEYFEADIDKLHDCLDKQPNPELINGGEATAPSKRILSCIPSYDKVETGVKIAADAQALR